MLVEKALNEALIDYTKGKKVYIVQEYDDKSMDISNLADFLEDKGVRMLVDVPAVSNQEWERAVVDMMSHGPEEEPTVLQDPSPEPKQSEKVDVLEDNTPNFSGGAQR